MTLLTTIAKIGTVLEAVDGIENVHTSPVLERSGAKARELYLTEGHLQAWFASYVPTIRHLGASTGPHTELDVEIEALRNVSEGRETASFLNFAELLEDVGQALLDPTAGFSQIDEAGIVIDLPKEPSKIATHHLAWKATMRFHLLDVTNT